MSFVLLTIGAVLLVASVRNTQDQLFSLLKGDFTGPNNFIYWFISIILIGALGYIKALKPLSNVLLALVIVVLFLKRGGFFSQFTSAIAGTQSVQATPTAATSASSLIPNIMGANNTGSILSSLPALPSLSSSLPQAPTLTAPTVSQVGSTFANLNFPGLG
jgi:hypothetical protein